MIGFHAEVLALLSDRPRNRPNIIACFPPSTHPDAVHKALYELLRAGVIKSTDKGLILTPEPKDDDHEGNKLQVAKVRGKAGGSSYSKLNGRERYNQIGHRLCPVCDLYLPPAKFSKCRSTWDGLYSRCKACDAKQWRKKRNQKMNLIKMSHLDNCRI